MQPTLPGTETAAARPALPHTDDEAPADAVTLHDLRREIEERTGFRFDRVGIRDAIREGRVPCPSRVYRVVAPVTQMQPQNAITRADAERIIEHLAQTIRGEV